MGDEAGGRRTALSAAVATALRAPRHATSGVAAIVSTFASLARVDVVAAFAVRHTGARTIASAGTQVGLVGPPGVTPDELTSFLLDQVSCAEPSGSLPAGFDAFPHRSWECCPVANEEAVVLLVASCEPPLLGLREIIGPVASLAAIASARDQVAALETSLGRIRQEQSVVSAELQHDLRVPLHTVMSAAETLRDRGELLDAGQHEHLLTIIVKQASRAAELASGALSGNSSAAPVRRIRCDLSPLIRSAADAVQARHGGEVMVDVPELEVETDPQRLERAVANLLDNALKHGGKTAPVNVSVGRVDGGVVVEVCDRGPGVKDSILPSLFGAFVTDPDVAGGTGVGLHSVRTIANELGGQVTYSRRDGWTRFSLTLPVDVQGEQAVHTERIRSEEPV